MKQYLFLLLLLSVLYGCSESSKEIKEEALPNIVLIIADDLGYPYSGFMGDTIVQTPHLDKLANMGTVFNNALVPQSHCAPSLRTIITGLHSAKYNVIRDQIRVEKRAEATAGLSQEDSLIWENEFQWRAMPYFKTLPKYLAEKGYVSFQGGKWWEFDYQSGGFTHGMSTGWTKEDRQTSDFFYKLMGNEGLKLGRVTNQPVFDFIDEFKDQPFFIWYAPDLPHYPLNAPENYYDIYKDQPLSESAKRYYANCTWFDDQIGELNRYFEENQLMENTLFIYVNDNGWDQSPTAEYRHDSLRWHNGGPKGKGAYFDMSYRTPIFFSWKGKLLSETVKSELVSSMDILPTILDYLDIEKPADLKGQSLRPNIEKDSNMGREKLFGRITQVFDEASRKTYMGSPADGYWVRTPDYHYVQVLSQDKEFLFDMTRDPMNEVNIVGEHPELVAGFKDDIAKWKQEIYQ